MTTQEQKTTRRKELGIFLLFSFGLAWLLQIAASKALLQGDAALFSPLLSLSMLCPLAGALACKLMFQSSLGVAGGRPLRENCAGGQQLGLARHCLHF